MEQAINQSVSTLELAVQEVTRVAWVMSEGDLTQVMSSDLEGEFDNIALALKCVSISVEGIVDDVRAIAEDMEQRGDAVVVSTKHAIELNNLMKFFSTNSQDPSSVKAKKMSQNEEIKRLVSDLNG